MKTVVLSIGERATEEADYPIILDYYDTDTGQFDEESRVHHTLPGHIDEFADEALDRLREQGEQRTVLEEIGNRLYKFIEETPAGAKWLRLCEHAGESDGEPPTCAYLDVAPEKLQSLPWELMAANGGDGAFWAKGHRPVRGHPAPPAMSVPERVPLPIRVLVVIYDANPGHGAQAEVDKIVEALRKQAGIWQIFVLENPSLEQLEQKLNEYKWQALHLIGQIFDDTDPAFRIPDSTHDTEELRLAELEPLLYGPNSPPLLLVPKRFRTAHSGFSAQYQRLRTRAIVANQAIVYSEAAIAFIGMFYEKLALTGAVDEAMRQARVSLKNQWRDISEWATPTLTVYGAPGDVIPHDLPTLNKLAYQILHSGHYGHVGVMVNRMGTREKIWKSIYEEGEKHVILVKGWQKAGKSVLLRSCVLTCKLRGSTGIIADMKEVPPEILRPGRDTAGRRNAREVLLHICACLEEQAGLPQPVRKELAQLAKSLSDIDETALGDREATSPFQEACAKLLRVLSDAAREREIIIGLDHVDRIQENDLKGPIQDYLLKPIARNRAGRVYVIIAVNEHDLMDRTLGWLPDDAGWSGLVREVTSRFFTREDRRRYGHEYSARTEWPDEKKQDWNAMFDMGRDPIKEPSWSPIRLFRLAKAWEEG